MSGEVLNISVWSNNSIGDATCLFAFRKSVEDRPENGRTVSEHGRY